MLWLLVTRTHTHSKRHCRLANDSNVATTKKKSSEIVHVDVEIRCANVADQEAYVKYRISLRSVCCTRFLLGFCPTVDRAAYTILFVQLHGKTAAADCNRIPVSWCTVRTKGMQFMRDTFHVPSTGNRNIIKMRRDVTMFALSVVWVSSIMWNFTWSVAYLLSSHKAQAKYGENFNHNSRTSSE